MLPVCWNAGKLVSTDAADRSPKVTGLDATPGASALTRVTPFALGSRTEVSAWPLASGTAAAAESCAPLEGGKVPGAPITRPPAASRHARPRGTRGTAPGRAGSAAPG